MAFYDNTSVFILLLFLTSQINHVCICKASDEDLCISSERQALLTLKHHLLDPSNRLASWSESTNCCNWTSVVCNDVSGHVIQLHLRTSPPCSDQYADRTSGFGGELHHSLLDLKHMTHLDLSGSDFGYTQIPGFLFSLESLTYLNLSNAVFSGNIPHLITNLSSLVYLDLGGNFFTGNIPHQIGNLSSLLYLDLGGNSFTGIIPHQMGNLSSLLYLDIGGNYYYGMDGIPLFVENLQWLSSISSLKYLQLFSVNLSNAFDWLHVLQSLPSLLELHLTQCTLHHRFDPAIITNFTSLAILDLSSSYPLGASSIPKWIFQQKDLVSLQLGGNNFQGSIPDGIQNLTHIENLDLSHNAFNSIPEWLYSMSRLKSLTLGYNKFDGAISNAIGNLTSMVTLDLSSNQLEGPIPSSIRNLCSLKSLSFSNKKCNQSFYDILEIISGCASHTLESLFVFDLKINGPLTSQIGIFKNLHYLGLFDNSIVGEIPKSLGNLTFLNYLDLSGNKFNGNPFDVIQSLSSLQSLDISDNHFQGEVTEDHLANFTNLYEFHASGNKLILKVSPDWTPSFKTLKKLYMDSWNLGPRFPSWMQSLKCLEWLSIPNTNIFDSIPKWVWDVFPYAYSFDISNNNIHGDLSDTIKNPINVSIIDLSSNRLSGALPYISVNVLGMDLSNNSLSGSLDSFLCQGKVKQMGLVSLNLESNNLSGEIPDCWMMWQDLMYVQLDRNHFRGNLPRSLGSIPWLDTLRLRSNALSGDFPICLKNNTRFVFLDLSENELSGIIPLWVGHNLLNLKVFLLRTNKFKGDIPNQICCLNSLQILDLAENNLTGQMPKCINNLTAMLVKNNSLESYIRTQGSHISGYFITDVLLTLKGRHDDYTFPGLIMSIDLSHNNLSGEIPSQIGSLMGLRFLNLSNNLLHGVIPQSIGNMGSLESIDFSRNKLCGEIPRTISNLNFLDKLNLSYNNLTGKIPTGTQLQSLEADGFVGNDLCGPPLPKKCIGEDEIPNNGHNEKESEGNGVKWFYVSISLGFVSGFWMVVGPLLYNRSWRYTYFCFLDRMWFTLQSFWW